MLMIVIYDAIHTKTQNKPILMRDEVSYFSRRHLLCCFNSNQVCICVFRLASNVVWRELDNSWYEVA